MRSKSLVDVPSTSRFFEFVSDVVGRLVDGLVVVAAFEAVEVAPEMAHSASAVAVRPFRSQQLSVGRMRMAGGLHTGSFRSMLTDLAHKFRNSSPVPLTARLVKLLEISRCLGLKGPVKSLLVGRIGSGGHLQT